MNEWICILHGEEMMHYATTLLFSSVYAMHALYADYCAIMMEIDALGHDELHGANDSMDNSGRYATTMIWILAPIIMDTRGMPTHPHHHPT